MNLTLKETTFGTQINFLDSDHVRYIRGAITLDESEVSADGNGLKKLDAGSFVGKLGNGKYAKYAAGTTAYKWEYNSIKNERSK
jgi:hypothetical protein